MAYDLIGKAHLNDFSYTNQQLTKNLLKSRWYAAFIALVDGIVIFSQKSAVQPVNTLIDYFKQSRSILYV
jgi:hypothetical protein